MIIHQRWRNQPETMKAMHTIDAGDEADVLS